MSDIETIHSWLRTTYNDAISLYKYESDDASESDYIEFTNGSGEFEILVCPEGESIVLEGQWGDKSVRDLCANNKDALLSTLATYV